MAFAIFGSTMVCWKVHLAPKKFSVQSQATQPNPMNPIFIFKAVSQLILTQLEGGGNQESAAPSTTRSGGLETLLHCVNSSKAFIVLEKTSFGCLNLPSKPKSSFYAIYFVPPLLEEPCYQDSTWARKPQPANQKIPF
jgi:hypothetical protein